MLGVRWPDEVLLRRRVTPAEFRAAQAVLALSDEDLAADLGLSPEIVAAWAAGSVVVPRRYAKQLTWLTAAAERANSLRESGLQECEWAKAAEVELDAIEDSEAAVSQLEAIESHSKTCATCIVRKQFVAEKFGPMPPPPHSSWFRVFLIVDRIPSFWRPVAMGAAFLGAMTSLRVFFALPAIGSNPALLG
jgi:hypothetical protein